MVIPQETKHKIPYDPAIPFLFLNTKKLKALERFGEIFYIYVYSSTTHTSRNMETPKMPTTEENQADVARICDGMLLSQKGRQ